MDDFDLQCLSQNALWQKVLGVYAELAAEPAEPRPEAETGPRWSARIESLEEIDAEELAGIHGQLIAFGWLRFQLEDRNVGLKYRISPEGKQALERVNEPAFEANARAAA